ncbi:MAG: hypothetical protein K2I96_07040, partial [Lachnospiraceae bacterium]|nr:hypothetical protein [Lachnospiraceae bacterium]
RQILPLVIAVFITMTSTASASLSLEGKNRWIMCSAPVRAIDIFNSKIAVNLTVICPFVLISAVLLGFKMGISLTQANLLCIVPTVYAHDGTESVKSQNQRCQSTENLLIFLCKMEIFSTDLS